MNRTMAIATGCLVVLVVLRAAPAQAAEKIKPFLLAVG